jgi:hypothetical protein
MDERQWVGSGPRHDIGAFILRWRVALCLFPTANGQPLTANTLSFCFLNKTHLTQD